MDHLTELRDEIGACPSRAVPCRTLTRFMQKVWPIGFEAPAARHPPLPDDLTRDSVRICVVGIQLGNAANTSGVAEYLRKRE